MKIIQICVQILIITTFLLIGNTIHSYAHLPIPGSVIGLVLLFLALYLHIIPLKAVDVGAKLLTAELLLFFIPSAVGIMNYPDLFGIVGIKLIIIIFISTVFVMMGTGVTAHFLSRKKVQTDDFKS